MAYGAHAQRQRRVHGRRGTRSAHLGRTQRLAGAPFAGSGLACFSSLRRAIAEPIHDDVRGTSLRAHTRERRPAPSAEMLFVKLAHCIVAAAAAAAAATRTAVI